MLLSRQRHAVVCAAACGALLAVPSGNTGQTFSQDQPSIVTARRDILPGTEHLYEVSAGAGDLVEGFLDPGDAQVAMEVRDKAGTLVRRVAPPGRVGFIAPASGVYSIRVGSTGKSTASYALRLAAPISPAARMRDVAVIARDIHRSPRVARLLRELHSGDRAAADRFLAEAAKAGGVLVEPISGDERHLLATLLWRQTYDTYNVLLNWPVAWDRAADYYMSRVPGTDLWFKTLRVHRSSRFSYTISPNDRPSDRALTSQPDPLNPSSVFEGPDAPDEQWYREEPSTRGRLQQSAFHSAHLDGSRTVWIYTPPNYRADVTYPLVILFDGRNYVDDDALGAPRTLDNLISAGRIQPPVVCFFGNVRGGGDLGLLNERMADAVALELVPWLRSRYGVSTDATKVTIGGYSGSAVKASLIALTYPNVFGNVLAQSGSFRQQPPGTTEPNFAARKILESPRVAVRFYIDSGLYEPAGGGPDRPFDELLVNESNTASNRHFRDVLLAKGYRVTYRETGGAHEFVHWRATLAEALLELLATERE